MAHRPLPSLTRDQIVAEAFRLLQEEGLESLSMRRLAARLDVQAPALYWHVADKAELLGLMAGAIYGAAYAGAGAARDWREWLGQFGRALHASLASHRDGARLCAIARPTAPADPDAQAGRIAAPLTALGLDVKQALAHQAVVISFTLGWTTFETNGPMRDFLRQIMDFDSTFTIGLDALVSGLDHPATS
ncbi:TetR family transcriptional regulator [Sphingobium sp. SYK-6]|uniref:TetR family transcriptional regulator n=1 Tax=Sphingobium sp. (strain NBRC 103272 / SYK-6) TaxID=627192 RepID=UPI0001DD3D34|nr:TetR family transcriptional regulator [Sphingobium sp. SYK-6]BAJ11990.1 putative TetR family transcriptional regulator [Sphingobium sp. SYK-6]BAK67936.1 TetR family transcriptional regulator [Sphingobium sp. SYK-6]